jgi:hypothetical protein
VQPTIAEFLRVIGPSIEIPFYVWGIAVGVRTSDGSLECGSERFVLPCMFCIDR